MSFGRISALLMMLSFVFAASPPAQADIVTYHVLGTVTGELEDNPFDIHVGDALRGTITYDSGLLTGTGEEKLFPTSGSGFSVTIDLGAFHFETGDDAGFPNFPDLDFVDGSLVNLTFAVGLDEFLFVLANGIFAIIGNDDLIARIEGDFTLVPEPAALSVFAIALGGLAALRRRRA